MTKWGEVGCYPRMVFHNKRISELFFERRVGYCQAGEVWREFWLEMNVCQRVKCDSLLRHCAEWSVWLESRGHGQGIQEIGWNQTMEGSHMS